MGERHSGDMRLLNVAWVGAQQDCACRATEAPRHHAQAQDRVARRAMSGPHIRHDDDSIKACSKREAGLKLQGGCDGHTPTAQRPEEIEYRYEYRYAAFNVKNAHISSIKYEGGPGAPAQGMQHHLHGIGIGIKP